MRITTLAEARALVGRTFKGKEGFVVTFETVSVVAKVYWTEPDDPVVHSGSLDDLIEWIAEATEVTTRPGRSLGKRRSNDERRTAAEDIARQASGVVCR